MKEQVKISITELTKQVNNGMRKKEIAEFYGIPEFQVGKLLKQANLKIRKIHALGFVLVDDTKAPEVTTFTETVKETWEGLEVLREFIQNTPQKLVTVEEFIEKQNELQKEQKEIHERSSWHI